MPHIELAQGRIEYRVILGRAGSTPPLVFLHEGLGSVSLWRGFPDALAKRLGAVGLVYSRHGYGQSDGLKAPRTPRFMHEEALDVLPALLDRLRIERPLLIGHSDGASIALIHAASAGRPVAGVVLLAPHVFVEAVTVKSIAATTELYETGELKARLARHHAHVDDAFLGWSRIWLSPTFQSWNLGREAAALAVPSLLIQGADDEYGTLAQLDAIADVAPTPPRRLVIDGAGHSPHRDAAPAVIDAIAAFAADLTAAPSA
jgi:pimeloyl-ACP methyl ester carboxylesterase